MSVHLQAVPELREGDDLWFALLIAGLGASFGGLWIWRPSLVFVALFGSLMLAAALRFDLVMYWFLFSLPWYPLFNLPVRDVYLLLRVVLFIGVWLRFSREKRSVREWLIGSRLKKAVWLFLFIATLSFFRSGIPADIHAFRELALLLSYIMVFFAIDGWLQNETQTVRVLKLLLVSTIGVALFGFCQAIAGSYTELYFYLYPFEAEAIAPWAGRITSFLFQENSLAGYLNLVIPVALACATLAEDRTLRFLGIACSLTAITALFPTQSRGGLLALAGILVLAVWFLVPRLATRIKLFCGGVLACMLILPLLVSHFSRLQGVLDDPDATGRLYVWAAAVNLFASHPFLGVGYGNYRFLYADFSFIPNAVEGLIDSHSLYLQLLAETGIVGFACFFLVVGLFIRLALKSIREHDALSRMVAFGVLGAIAGALIHGLFDYLFGASPQFGALFWIVLGLGSGALAESSRKMASQKVPS